MTSATCPICLATPSPVGVTYHAAQCPNGLAQTLAWTVVPANDARVLKQDGTR